MLGLEKFICTTITREIGVFMLSALVSNHRSCLFLTSTLLLHIFCMHNSCALNFVLTDDSFLHLCSFLFQILSQCNIYEAGEKKAAFKYLTEKVFPWAYRKFSVK